MARVNYKGYDLPDGAAVPDVPADLRLIIDTLSANADARAQRVIAEVNRTGDSGNIGTSSVAIPGSALTFTPRAGCQYYARFGCRIAVSAAAVGFILTLNTSPPGVGGAAWAQWEGRYDTAAWFQAESPILGLVVGTPITLALVGRCLTTSQYFVLTGATTRPGTYQILERGPLG